MDLISYTRKGQKMHLMQTVLLQRYFLTKMNCFHSASKVIHLNWMMHFTATTSLKKLLNYGHPRNT